MGHITDLAENIQATSTIIKLRYLFEQIFLIFIIHVEKYLELICNIVSPPPFPSFKALKGDGEAFDELCHLIFTEEECVEERQIQKTNKALENNYWSNNSVYEHLLAMNKFSEEFYSDDAIFGVID